MKAWNIMQLIKEKDLSNKYGEYYHVSVSVYGLKRRESKARRHYFVLGYLPYTDKVDNQCVAYLEGVAAATLQKAMHTWEGDIVLNLNKVQFGNADNMVYNRTTKMFVI